ncbi:hypothetical protein [Streptomyces sp. S.PNR 29]|uniref:hypothetical protein n=1 Tax=Streptomyces sp. S.PNR 29 TaxID=2973805 RepID=UPI0025AED239|nr:hypothetical protein [Streptomyces sp. S.PNR 29]MDN0196947.1 hypothetical protein [Streptomyces sp. S.PNR 29]
MTETEPAPDRHPELVAWLETRAAGFERWARDTGAPEYWNFSPESLDALEELVRRTFAAQEEIAAARSGEFVQGAVWYIGEVIRRSAPDAVWRYDPFTSDDRIPERMFEPGVQEVGDTPHLGRPHFQDGDYLYPLGLLNQLFWETDELGEPVEVHLADVLEAFADDAD